MPKLKSIMIEDEKFFYSWSFDINDFVGDGIWWLQVYNSNKNLIYDRPFVSSVSRIDKRMVIKTIKDDFLTYQGAVL